MEGKNEKEPINVSNQSSTLINLINKSYLISSIILIILIIYMAYPKNFPYKVPLWCLKIVQHRAETTKMK